MNSFTDEDLKELKRLNRDGDVNFFEFVSADRVDALLARLEAAEKICETMWLMGLDGRYEHSIVEWRKAAGK